MGINVGQVTGQEIGTYRGLENVRILQVQLQGSNPDTILFFNVSGEDTAPANGDLVIVRDMGGFRMTLGTKDPILPISSAGEKEIYSHSSGSKLARLKLDSSGKIALGNASAELLQLFEDLVKELRKPVDLTGAASTGTLFKIDAALAVIETKIGLIKGSL